jgi:hypothetical protein
MGRLWRSANNPGTTLAWGSRDKDGPRACQASRAAEALQGLGGLKMLGALGPYKLVVYKRTHPLLRQDDLLLISCRYF